MRKGTYFCYIKHCALKVSAKQMLHNLKKTMVSPKTNEVRATTHVGLR